MEGKDFDSYASHSTAYGEIRCYKTGSKCRVTVFNPKSVNQPETTFFPEIFRELAKHLPKAQEETYQAWKAVHGHPPCQTCVGTEVCEHPPRAVCESTAAGGNAITGNRSAAFSKILSVYGSEPVQRVLLEGSLFNGNAYIWLTRVKYEKGDGSMPGTWQHRYGAFRFSVEDNADEILNFVEENVRRAESNQKLLAARRCLGPEFDALAALEAKVDEGEATPMDASEVDDSAVPEQSPLEEEEEVLATPLPASQNGD